MCTSLPTAPPDYRPRRRWSGRPRRGTAVADRLHRAAPIWAGDRAEAVGVAVMAYGTPAGPHDIERYYTDIRRGVPPSAEQLEELQRRYAAIGGGSPLLAIARAQAAGLQASLEARAPGRFLVRLGMKHSPPFIEGAIQELIAQGARRIVGLVLAPHYSALSTGEYAKRAAAAAADRAAVRLIASWHMLPAYIDALASRLCAALQTVPSSARDDLEALFTAHSLPERILGWGRPVPTRAGADRRRRRRPRRPHPLPDRLAERRSHRRAVAWPRPAQQRFTARRRRAQGGGRLPRRLYRRPPRDPLRP
jgi:hypothetical protein